MKRIEKRYIHEDLPIADLESVARHKSSIFISEGEKINGIVLMPDARFPSPRPCVIMSHGFPGNVVMDDFANALTRAGCVTITYHYRGSWGSKGSYLLSHNVEDLVNIFMHVRDKGESLYGVDPKNIYLFGHSIGGFTTIAASRKLKDEEGLRGLVVLAPYDPTIHMAEAAEGFANSAGRAGDNSVGRGTAQTEGAKPNPEESSDGTEAAERLMRAANALNIESIEEFIKDIVTREGEMAFSEATEVLASKNVLMMTALGDTVAPPDEMVDPIWPKVLEYRGEDSTAIHRRKDFNALHSFYGARLSVVDEAADFIEETLLG